jgi:WD40 repeat protein
MKTKAQGSAFAFTPDSRHIVAGQTYVRGDGYFSPSSAAQVDIWDVKRGRPVARSRANMGFTAIAYSWNGRYRATAYAGGEVRLTDTRSGRVVRRIKSSAESIAYLCFSPDDLTLAAATVVDGGCGSSPGSVLLFNSLTGKERPRSYRGVFRGLEDTAESFARWFAVHPSMHQVMVCTRKGILVKPVNGQGKSRYLAHSAGFDSIAVSRDGTLVAGLSSSHGEDFGEDAGLALWDFATGRRIVHLRKAMERITAAEIEFSPDSRYLAISSDIAGMIRVWRVKRAG